MKYNLLAACALLLVLEGFLPTVAPKLWRRMVEVISQQSDSVLRIVGLILMILGAGLLFILHNYS